MSIIFISASLSSNALGRTTSLAKLAPDTAYIEVWGPRTRAKWSSEPMAVRGFSRAALWDEIRNINTRHRDGEEIVFWISKGYPWAWRIVRRLSKSIPVIVDFDDHDIALAQEFIKEKFVHRLILNPLREGSPSRVKKSQNLILARANSVTVSSFALAQELGIEKSYLRIPHARPNLKTSPYKVAKVNIRTRKLISFLGTMRAHKGFNEILSALENDPDLYCRVFEDSVALDTSRQWLPLPKRTPLNEAYKNVTASVLPMGKTIGSKFQLPAKAVDSAASGTPIVANETPVLSEYFGAHLLRINDWRQLGEFLDKWQENGDLSRASRNVHEVWRNQFDENLLRKTVSRLLATLPKSNELIDV